MTEDERVEAVARLRAQPSGLPALAQRVGEEWDGEVVVSHDDVPPSANTSKGVGGRGNPHAVAKTKKQWAGVFMVMLMQGKVPRNCERIEVEAHLQFVRPNTRRDVDNFYFPIAKPLGDVLTSQGYLEDDTPDHFELRRVRMDPEKLETRSPLVKARINLTIRWRLREAA